MRRFINKTGLILFGIVLALSFVFNLVFAQAVPVAATVADFPYILLIILVLGMGAHWITGYQKGTVGGANIFTWFLSNVPATLAALISAITGFVLLYASQPSAYEPITINTIVTVFLLGYTGDSALNKTKVQPPPAL